MQNRKTYSKSEKQAVLDYYAENGMQATLDKYPISKNSLYSWVKLQKVPNIQCADVDMYISRVLNIKFMGKSVKNRIIKEVFRTE